MRDRSEGESRTKGLMWGLALVGVGASILVTNAGWVSWMTWTVWWPWITIALGFAQLVAARRPKDIGGGSLLVMMGVWFLIAVHGWMGLGWRNSWPLALVAVGLSMMLQAVASWFMRSRDEGPVEVRHDL